MVVYSHTLPSGQTLKLVRGDITEEETDAIVNAANERLQHGGGVAGAIVRKGGRIIQEESNRIGYVPTGSAAITGAGNLKAKWVIHAVGPVFRENDPDMDELLASALKKALVLAHEKGITSIAIPAISSGIFGFPKERCAKILLDTAVNFLQENPQSPLRELRFTIIDEPTLEAFRREFLEKLGIKS